MALTLRMSLLKHRGQVPRIACGWHLGPLGWELGVGVDETQMKEEVSQHRRNSQQPTRPVTSVETPKTPLCPRTSWGRGRPPRSRQLLSGQVITVASLRGRNTGRGAGARFRRT